MSADKVNWEDIIKRMEPIVFERLGRIRYLCYDGKPESEEEYAENCCKCLLDVSPGLPCATMCCCSVPVAYATSRHGDGFCAVMNRLMVVTFCCPCVLGAWMCDCFRPGDAHAYRGAGLPGQVVMQSE